MMALWSGFVSGLLRTFVPPVTTVPAGRPSAESFDRSPPRQFASSARTQALISLYGRG